MQVCICVCVLFLELWELKQQVTNVMSSANCASDTVQTIYLGALTMSGEQNIDLHLLCIKLFGESLLKKILAMFNFSRLRFLPHITFVSRIY